MSDPEPRLDAVLPLTLRDCERAQILLDSLEIFFPGLHTLHVIAPSSQVAAVASKLRFSRLKIRSEDEVLPELRFWRRLFRATVAFRRRPDGWYVQQLTKLAGPRYVGSAHYLTFDADVICARPTRPSDLVRDGRSLCQRPILPGEHEDWYAWAERVLGLRRQSRYNHGATPLMYATDAMRRLHQHLEARAHAPTQALGRLLPNPGHWNSWVGVLMRNLPWAEHTMYHVFLENQHAFDRYHADIREVRARPLHDHSVWNREEFVAWDPARAFADDGPYFCLVQSWLGIAPEEVRRRVGAVCPGLALPTPGAGHKAAGEGA